MTGPRVIFTPDPGRFAYDRLTRALLDLHVKPRCGEPEVHHLFTSEDAEERAEATGLCGGCEVRSPCAEVGRFQRFGVFGGIDRSPRRPSREETSAAQGDAGDSAAA